MRRTRAAVPALVLLAIALAGCSGGSDDSNSGSDSAPEAAMLDESSAQRGVAAESEADQDAAAFSADLQDSAPEPASVELEDQRAVIRKGNVALRADDVGKVQFDVQKIVDEHDGRVTEEETTTDDDGNPAYTRMVLRVPESRFDDVLADLKVVPDSELEHANTSEQDVTTKLIDTRTRIEAQRRSIARITVLFDRATSIRDIMAIEGQLSRRQADLEALQRTAAYLTAQTTMSTIVVSIDQIPEKKAAAKPESDDAGFVTGLQAGWDALTTFAVGLATALGALLPWMIVVAIVGPPAYLLYRRRFSKSGRTPSAA